MKKMPFPSLGVLLIPILLLPGLTGTSQAAPLLQKPPSPHFPDREWEEIPFLDVDLSQPASPGSVAAPSTVPWSRLVFQSLREGNWEIYLANGNGSNQTRLTYNRHSDIHPRLNRGCTRIVYASNPKGNYEIYVMSLDGSGWIRLTHNDADDVLPVWSPDETKIAFQSYRDRQAEIYVMNADGSGQTRLTFGDGYDGEPTWSPDGTKIAFTSNRTGQYHIWVMNADGSGQMQLSFQPYSENATWSPNGNKIAYDSDGDGDGWQELWLMNADGSKQRQLYDVEPQTSAWARSWSPDGRYVAFTRISFIQFRSRWYWTNAYLDGLEIFLGSVVRLSSAGTDWRPDWQTLDTEPPIVAIDPLPQYSRYWNTPVSWSGQDVGQEVSGLQSFDVQVRQDGGDWQDWLEGTQETNQGYSGKGGQHVAFRVRARDAAHNTSTWTSGPPSSETWLYAYQVSGHVQDIRNIPLPDAQVSVEPPSVYPVVQTMPATYLARRSQLGPTQVSASATGYGLLPESSWDTNYDLTIDFHLPPADDLIENGGFEANGGSFAGWDVDGEPLPQVTTQTWHTGQASAFLGQDVKPALDPWEMILSEEEQPVSYDIAVDPDGVVHLVYNHDGIYYRQRTVQGKWSDDVRITSDHLNRQPAIAASATGDIHIVWGGDSYVHNLYHRKLLPDGSWTPKKLIVWGSRGVDIATDSQGGLHVVSEVFHARPKAWYAYRTPDGDWKNEEAASDICKDCRPSIAVDPHDTVHLLYSSERGVYHRQRSVGEQWRAPDLIRQQGCARALKIVADSKGRLYACYGTRAYAVRSVQEVWSQVEVPEPFGCGDLAVDSADTLYAVATFGDVDDKGLYFTYKPFDRSWSTPARFHDGKAKPTAAVDQGNSLHVFYGGDFGGRYQISARSQVTAASTISQTVTVPSDLHQPTLSWLYKLRGVMPGNSEGFQVLVSEGLTPTVVYSTTESVDWTHAWVDLSSWQGQTVTVIFTSQTGAGEHYTQLTLDEISLGSWRTPVPLTLTPGQVDVGASTVFTITGENFVNGAKVRLSDVRLPETRWINSTTLTTTLSVGLVPGIYDLWVANPGGRRGVLRGALVAGRVEFLPLALKQAP